ncbi:MAG: hypothetical protein ABI977_30185 [Acidobacteriota bacterium]
MKQHENSEKTNSLSFYKLMDAIRQRPGLYLGRNSILAFDAWLQGYWYAQGEFGIPLTEEEIEFRGFDDFIRQKYDWDDEGGWAAKIQYYYRDDARALDEFFKLLDEFRESKTKQDNQAPKPNEN